MAKIALIDDDPALVRLLDLILSEDHEVSAYHSGADGLAGLRRDRPDAVLLDIDLGDMTGVEVLRALRADPALADLPVIAVTSHAQAQERSRYLREGFTDYVSKPITDEGVLLATIESALTGESMPFLDEDPDLAAGSVEGSAAGSVAGLAAGDAPRDPLAAITSALAALEAGRPDDARATLRAALAGAGPSTP